MESGLSCKGNTICQTLCVSQSGAVLLLLIAALTFLGVLAGAVQLLLSAATGSAITNNRQTRARYLALAGLNTWSTGMTGTFVVGSDSFTLAQSGPDTSGYYTVVSTGTVLGGTTLEANAVLTAKRFGLSPITFTADLDAFTPPVVGQTENNSSAITVYAANTGTNANGPSHSPGHGGGGHGNGQASQTSAYASGSLRFAAGVSNTHGAIWYTGSRGTCTNGVCPDGMCTAGKCTFAKGLRAYFGFRFANEDDEASSLDYGDGFTFTVMNASNNSTSTAAGGPQSGSRGEYLGYSGPGPSGCGIAAPKLAVEVDIYPNKGSLPPTSADSRRDHSNANHIAAVFWGTGSTLYDDNVHGVGTSPANPTYAASGEIGYCEQPKQAGEPNWLEDKAEHTLRLEIARDDLTSGGSYRIKVWIDGTGDAIANVTQDYTATTPDIDYTTTLTAADHTALNTIYFGWTEGTGAQPQDVAIHDFSLEFRR